MHDFTASAWSSSPRAIEDVSLKCAATNHQKHSKTSSFPATCTLAKPICTCFPRGVSGTQPSIHHLQASANNYSTMRMNSRIVMKALWWHVMTQPRGQTNIKTISKKSSLNKTNFPHLLLAPHSRLASLHSWRDNPKILKESQPSNCMGLQYDLMSLSRYWSLYFLNGPSVPQKVP